MKLTKYMSIILVLMMLFVFGCTNSDGNVASSGRTFIGGVEGIGVSFNPGSPPAEIFDEGTDDKFDIIVKLENKGEETVRASDVFVKISGLAADDFNVAESALIKHPDEDVLGLGLDPEGNVIDAPEVYVNFEGLQYNRILNNNIPNQIVQAKACYKYATKTVSNLCVKQDLLKNTADSVCTVTGAKDVTNSGAPIRISSLEETPYGRDKIAFTFVIDHQSSGSFFEPETGDSNRCDTTDYNSENRVRVKVKTYMDGRLTCSPLSDSTASNGEASGTARLSDGQVAVRCTQEVTTSSDFVKNIDIELEYDYLNVVQTSMIIKHTGFEE